jgi:hypothetical protein
MDLAHSMNPAGIEEDALSRRRLAGVDVSDYSDVSGLGNRKLIRHFSWGASVLR